MDDQHFRKLLDFLNLSWKGYRKVRKGVKKRVSRHMQDLGFHRMDEFLLAMEDDQEMRKQVENLMTISISRVFRDREVWNILENQVFPLIHQEGLEKVIVWSAGCACGEEAYSFKILWEAFRGQFIRSPYLELWATDMNSLYLEKARAGVYPLSSLKEIPPEMRLKYFQHVKETHFAISDSLKEGILWKLHSLLSEDLPRMGFQIIFLRNNLLTYYKDEVQKSALRRILIGLAPGGFLIIGAHEKIPGEFGDLSPFAGHRGIFRKAAIAGEGS
jgi:chemotaxis protein methyltransferase CheR